MLLFVFPIYHLDKDGNIMDYDERQERMVVANSEEEAMKKLDEYRKKMVADGFADFRFSENYRIDGTNIIV